MPNLELSLIPGLSCSYDTIPTLPLPHKDFLLATHAMPGPAECAERLNNINHAKMSPEEVKTRFQYARRHLEFSVKLYKMQLDAGRYFLHEHPQGASSWQEPCIKEVMKRHGVTRVVGDQCMYGLKSKEKGHEGPARKRTGFMTNSVCIAQQLQRRCPNRTGHVVHTHTSY